MSDMLNKEYSKLNSKDLTATFLALCYDGNLNSVFSIMDNNDLFEKIDKNYHSLAFELACSKGHIEIVKKFKSELYKYRISNFHGCEKAYINNQLEVFDYFLSDGSIDLELDRLLEKTFRTGNAEVAKRILTSDTFKKTPQILGTNHPEYKSIFLSGKLIHLNDVLIQACKDGHLSIVKLLLLDKDIPKNADIDYMDHEGLISSYKPLMLDPELTKFLLSSSQLKQHADIHAQNDALFIKACTKGDLDFMEYLLTDPELKDHADINAQDYYSITSALKLDRDDVAKFLLTDARLKEHIDISKSIEHLYCAHYERVDDDYNYDNEYEYKVLNYIISDCNFIPKDIETENILNQILVSIPELKQKYDAIKLASQLEQEFETNNVKKNDRKIKL